MTANNPIPSSRRSSKRSAEKLRLELRPSAALTAILVGLHAGGVLCLWLAPLPLLPQLVLSPLVALSLYRALRLHGLRRASAAVIAIETADDGACVVQQRTGGAQAARLAGAFVQRLLVVLRLRREGALLPLYVVIPADAADTECLRRLRLRLGVSR